MNPPRLPWVEEDGRCLVMGIVNRTPDSFYDGGRMDLQASVDFALDLVAQGADILDLGAVKAGPGPRVSESEELERLLPLVESLRAATDVPLSIETASVTVADAALEAGASILNEVTGLRAEEAQGLMDACARVGAAAILMHSGGQVRGRPRVPLYEDVVLEVKQALAEMAGSARAAGVPAENIVVDPGLDFGKTTFHSLQLMRRLEELTSGPYPVLVAPSRKDIVGETLDLPPLERLEGTLALVALSVAKGARLVRVHDVEASVRVVRMVEAVLGRRSPLAPLRGLWE